jgi:hypothetical protein
MKHVRNFESFKNNRNVVTESQQNYYYKKGKASRKSIFEMELLSEGYSNEFIQSINESYSLNRIDNRIIDCLYEYLITGKETRLELLTEEIGGIKLPGIGDMYKKVAGIIDKGIEIGKSAIKSFGDFLKNIGNIVKNLFAKIKAFFGKVWELFKPQVVVACGVIAKAVGGGSPEKMTKAVETISSDQGQNEFDALYQDLKGATAKFASGSVGNISPEAEEHIKSAAEEYKGVVDDAEIDKLMQESIERKSTVGKIFYSMKGFISEGGTIEEMEKVFEADEVKLELKEGDEASYTNKDGKEVTKKILRIEGDNVFFQLKDGGEFTKKLSEIKKSDGIGKKILHGFVGEEPEKKGVFGWLVESIGFIFNPLAKLKEMAIKGGTNGMFTMISTIKRGMKNAFKFVVIGVIAGLVYHIIHGIMALTGGHEEGHEEGHEGEDHKKTAAAPAAPKTGPDFTKKPKINLNKESFEFINESNEIGLLPVDLTKNTKYTAFFDTLSSSVVPILGSVLVAALSKFFPIVHTILEIILVSIGTFELVGAMCKLESVAKKGLKVCKVQHDVHHFLEGAVSGGGH